MKKIITVLSLCISLLSSPGIAGSNNPYDRYSKPRAADGFSEPVAEYDKRVIHLKMVYFDKWSDLAKEYEEITGKSAHKKLYAFSGLIPDKNGCIIFSMDPRVLYAPEFIGHELVHCAMGRWHD